MSDIVKVEEHQEVQPSPHHPWIYLLLLMLLGDLGGHRFYLGKVGSGIGYALTGGFLGIGRLVDICVVIAAAPKDAEGRHLAPDRTVKIFSVFALVLQILWFAFGVWWGFKFGKMLFMLFKTWPFPMRFDV